MGNWVLCLEASGVIHLIIYIIGTVAPNAAISTMPFTPDESYASLKYYQSNDKICDNRYV